MVYQVDEVYGSEVTRLVYDPEVTWWVYQAYEVYVPEVNWFVYGGGSDSACLYHKISNHKIA